MDNDQGIPCVIYANPKPRNSTSGTTSFFHNRKESGPSDVKTYVKTFNQKQSNFREEFKRFGAPGCDKKSYGLQVPVEVYETLETEVTIEIQARRA